jgi:TrmH family RNA methyltransferase
MAMPPEEITSLHNPRVKRTVRLRESRQRQKQQRILIDGARELLRAVEAGIEIEELFVCPAACHGEQSRTAWERAERNGARVTLVTPPLLEKLAFGQRNEGLVAVAVPPQRTLDQLKLPRLPLVAVLEGVEKPGNVGAVLRSADAAGVSALIVTEGGTDLYNPNAIRASLGTIFTVPVCAASAVETLEWLVQHGLRIHAARVNAQQLYTDVNWRGPTAVVLGSEAHGLSAAWFGDEVTGVRLPMRGAADSLNVSAAAAVLFYEALRQRSLVDGQ